MGDIEIVMAMLQGMFIFFLIAGLTCLLSKRLGRRMGRGRCSRYMESQDRLVIGQDKYLEIVRIGERILLLGVSQSGIHLLTMLEDNDMIELEKRQSEDNSFITLLEKMAEKKKELP